MVAMKALSFLGTGEYKTVTYVWRGETFQTDLFPEAVARIFKPERVFVFITPQVRGHKNFQMLSQRLGPLLEAVEIPEGNTEADLWAIFDRVTSVVNDRDTVLLDVTHAFRSIPMIVLTVAAYLRRTKSVTVERIIYGAYEAREPLRNPPQPEDQAPIFDLTSLLDLLDWLAGAEALLWRGDAQTLAERMERTHRRLWLERSAEPQHLQNVAHKLKSLSQAIYLSRPIDVMRIAHKLLSKLDKAQQEFHRWAQPFAVIVAKVRDEIAPLAHKEPERLDAENLRKQLHLVEYYLRKGLIVQAITLAREWVVSWAVLRRGQGDWQDPTARKEAEEALGAAVQRWCRKNEEEVPEWFARLPMAQTAAEVWDWLTQLRNDVAHCGMTTQAAPAERIDRRSREIPNYLRALLDGMPSVVLWSGRVVIDLKTLYEGVAKLDELPVYIERAQEQAGEGQEIVLTGQAPIWLYLAVVHALHGKARRLFYDSPTTGEVLIFDHSAR
jgi:CRISPR-associated DxTHG motif protein